MKKQIAQWIGFLLFLSTPYCVLSASNKIVAVEIEGAVTISKEQVLGLLPLKIGDDYDPQKLEIGVEHLKKWGIFDSIQTTLKEGDGGMIIHLDLHQGEIVSQLSISGHYPYVATKIRKRLSLHVGDMIEPEKMAEQKDRIKSFYTKKGYYNTGVQSFLTPGAEELTTDVDFHIIKGERLRYESVEFKGVSSLRKGRVSSFIKPMDIYTEKRLKEAIRGLEKFYRAKGYLKVRAKVLDKQIDWKKRRVAIVIQISEGPRMKIFFKGLKKYRLKSLKEASGLYEEVNFDVVEMESAVEKLKEYFKKKGYLEAQITFKKEKINPNLYHISFFINPGPRSFIYSVDFEGNPSLSSRKLKKQIFTKERSLTQRGVLDESLIEEDQKIATKFYQSKGFLDATVGNPEMIKNPERTRLDMVFPVDEGPQVFVDKVVFIGNLVQSEKKLVKVLKNVEGKPVDQSFLSVDAEQVKLYYANNGFPYAEVAQTVSRTENRLTITYNIIEGDFVKIGEVLIVGDVLSGVRAIKQAMEIKEGDPYSYQKIINSQLNLRQLGAFNSVNITTIGLEEKATTVHLKVEIEEREPFTFSVEAQYSTDLKYAGTVRFNNLNAFGWAKQISLLLRGGPKTDRAELSWYDPRFAGHDLQMTVASWMDYFANPLETSLQGGGATSFFRQFHRFGFLTRYELARTYNIRGQAINPQNLRDNTLSKMTLSGSFDTRDSYSDPKNGLFSLGRTSFFNEIKGLRANFAKLRGAFSQYYTPFKFLTFTYLLRLDSIQNIGANISIPQRELLVLGGDDTIRGFREDVLGPTSAQGNPVGGRARFIFNGEAHIRLIDSVQGALFLDLGSLQNSFSEMNNNNIRRSAGFGLRYITPVGPVRADYGIILDRKTGENFGRLHITFGYPF